LAPSCIWAWVQIFVFFKLHGTSYLSLQSLKQFWHKAAFYFVNKQKTFDNQVLLQLTDTDPDSPVNGCACSRIRLCNVLTPCPMGARAWRCWNRLSPPYCLKFWWKSVSTL